jgi:hypothetical protein
MDRISRRQVIRGAAAAAGAMTLGAPFVHAQNQQTLRFVAQADLKILDPVWTTGYITRNHSCTTRSSAQTRTCKSNRKWSIGPRCLPTA